MNDFTRRGAVLSGLSLAACAPADWRGSYMTPANDPRFAAIENRIGGRVGVTAWNTATDEWLWHRARERFAMCSTFKWVLAAAQLHMAQSGGPQLGAQLRFDESDLLDYAPTAREHLARGWMTIGEACEAAVVLSDNTAANLLLEVQGGPAGFTRFLRANYDNVTRLDRTEPRLNEVPPGDVRDTTMPEAMVVALRRFLLNEDVLSPEHRAMLIGWMVESPTGRERLRAGFPADWRVGDKSGTWNGPTNATNDVAIAWPPGRAPIIVACYLSASTAEPAERNAAHAEIARIVAQEWS